MVWLMLALAGCGPRPCSQLLNLDAPGQGPWPPGPITLPAPSRLYGFAYAADMTTGILTSEDVLHGQYEATVTFDLPEGAYCWWVEGSLCDPHAGAGCFDCASRKYPLWVDLMPSTSEGANCSW